MIAALSRFVSRSTDRCNPFFKALKERGKVNWSEECEEAFIGLKQYLASPPMLSKPLPGETLYVYLAVSGKAVSSVLVREEERVQLPVYYSSKAFQGAEEKYSPLEKLALSLITAARKLRPYFQGHPIKVPTSFPLRQVLQSPEISGRLAKWSIELGEFDIEYIPRPAIKAQALADFLAEFTYPVGTDGGADQPADRPTSTADPSPSADHLTSRPAEPTEKSDQDHWQLFVDGASNLGGCGAGLVLVSPDGYRASYALRFMFQASNNEAEYEAVIAGLGLARELGVRRIVVHSDSMLVVNQVVGEFQANERMSKYLNKTKELLGHFISHRMVQIPRGENREADALARLASGLDDAQLIGIPVEYLDEPTVERGETIHQVDGQVETWMDPIIGYLESGQLPADRGEARQVRRQAARYCLVDGKLYRRGQSVPLQRCVTADQARYVMEEIHSGVCGNHSGGRSLVHKCLRQGYY